MTNTEVQSEARSTRGHVPITNILLNGEVFDITVLEATFSFAVGEHDSVTLKALSPTLDTTEGMLDSLLSFYFGFAPHIETFNGYIVGVEQAQDASGSLSFTLQVLGATKVMFEATPRFWTNKAIPNVVRDLSHRNLLGYTGHSHDHLWKAIAQTEESDWTMVNKLAQRIGWSLFSRYGVVLCQDPLLLFKDFGPYTRFTSRTDTDFTVERKLIDFSPTEVAEVVKESLGTKFGYFTTSNRVQISTERGEFRGYRFETDQVIRDQTEAAAYMGARGSVTADWKQHALARIWGDADIYPGMNIDIVTSSTRMLRDKYDGRWLVKVVGHSMDRQQFQSIVYLCRPSSTTPVTELRYTPFWIGGDSNGRAKPFLTIQEKRWVSSWTDYRARSIL